MADDIQFSITGLDSLLGKIDSIKQETKRKTGRAALRKAANVVRDAAKRNASKLDDPNTANDISANIAVRWDGKRFKKTQDLAFRVGVLGGARQYANNRWNRGKGIEGKTYLVGGDSGNPGGDTFYWRYHEFGTEHVPARPFMRPALQNNIGAATDTFIREYEKGIDRAIKRALKKGTTA